MSSNTVRRITSAFLSLLACSAVFTPSAHADEYLTQGIKLFNKKQYANARPYFDKAADNAPWDSNAFYYQALTAQYCKDWSSAKRLWAKVVEKFPGTPAAQNAAAALRSIDPHYMSSTTTASAGTTKPTGVTAAATPAATAPAAAGGGGDNVEALLAAVQYQAPQQAKIPIARTDNRVMLDVQFNNRSCKAEFSGSSTVLTVKDAKALQITNADRSPIQAGKRITMPVRVGDIVASGFPVLIEEGEHSRIGEDFFRKFTYQLDPASLIVTKKASSGGGGKTAYDVPFRKSGTDLIVDVTINGRRVSMVYDPKGGETVVPAKRAREFGLSVEESSEMQMFNRFTQTGPIRGEAGFGDIKTSASAEAKVDIGPVRGQAVTVKVDDKAKEAKLGSDAFAGWKTDVDPGASLIHFSR